MGAVHHVWCHAVQLQQCNCSHVQRLCGAACRVYGVNVVGCHQSSRVAPLSGTCLSALSAQSAVLQMSAPVWAGVSNSSGRNSS